MNLREKLILLRKETGYTQNQLADKLGISVNAIKNYEREKISRIPEIDILQKYSNFFNVSINYLLDDTISNKNDENIQINKILGLSDKSIDILKNSSNVKNDFIESDFFIDFIHTYEIYKLLLKLKSILNFKHIKQIDANSLLDIDSKIGEIYSKLQILETTITIKVTSLINYTNDNRLQDYYRYNIGPIQFQDDGSPDTYGLVSKFLKSKISKLNIEVDTTLQLLHFNITNMLNRFLDY